MYSPMTPPISYYGGKQRLASKIIPLIPRHTVICEPFAGSATILFKKPWPKVTSQNHYHEYINDIDGRLINFYRVLQCPYRSAELIYRLKYTLFSESEHRLAKDLTVTDDVDLAWRYFVNIQMSFTNKLNGGWGRKVFGGNLGATWCNKIDALEAFLDRMRAVHVSCSDALKFIKQMDSPQTFFYIDPPYPGTDCGHYSDYNLDDYKKLVTLLDSLQGSFLLSNYEQASVKKPDDWERFEFRAVNSSGGRVGYDRSRKGDESNQNRERTEIVWRRFNRVPVRPDIQKLYDGGGFDCFASPDSAWLF